MGAEAEGTGSTTGGAARIYLEQLPAYAPELNLDEGIWKAPKRVELRHL